jgi:hypothetical protein
MELVDDDQDCRGEPASSNRLGIHRHHWVPNLKCRAQVAIDSNPQARDLCIFGSTPSLVSVADQIDDYKSDYSMTT